MPGTGRKKRDDGGGGGGDQEKPSKSKYSHSLQTFYPFRRSQGQEKIFPSSRAGLFSFLTMSWMTSLMWKAFRTGLKREDIWELHEVDRAERNARRLKRIWEEEKDLKKEDASFRRAIWKFGRTRFYTCIVLMIISVVFQFLGPAWILRSILNFIEDPSSPLEIGIALAILAFVVQVIRNLTFGAFWLIGINTAMRVEGAMQFLTYEKMLRLRNGGDRILSAATTFCTNDQERIFECVAGGILVVAAPVMFTLSLVYTCLILGPWAILGNFIIFMFYPLMGMVARKIGMIRKNAVKCTNARVGLMTEILNSIRLIKMYSWEKSFEKSITDLRHKEEQQMRTAAFLQSLTATLTPMTNIIASIVTFLGFSLSGNDLTAESVFTIFSVFAAMQFTIGTLPFAVRSIAESSVSFRNFQKYLDLPEFKQELNENVVCDHDSVIVIKNGVYSWEVLAQEEPTVTSAPPKKVKAVKIETKNGGAPKEKDEEVKDDTTVELIQTNPSSIRCIHNLNVEIKRGALVGITGSVGSGKSALFSLLLGDMIKEEGELLIRGSLAIVTQQPWIYTDTFQENILFGLPMNKERYEAVLDACCLKPDLEALPKGDQTVVGERGFNLSGGQRQRLNLARSVYSDRSIFLLDDPLSSVDSRVGKTIFEKCIKGVLGGKTILLVSHNRSVLQQCDSILFFSDGTITERGSHVQLMSNRGDYYNLSLFNNLSEEEEAPTLHSNGPLDDLSPIRKNPRRRSSSPLGIPCDLFKEEDEMIVQKVGGRSYGLYIKACGGFFLSFVALALIGGFTSLQQLSSIWLKKWLDDGDGGYSERVLNGTGNETESELVGFINDNPLIGYYQSVLVLIVAVTLLCGLMKGFLTTRLILHGASTLHNQMFDRIVKSPLSFFDRTPTGRILNRCSKDLDELDARLTFFIEFVAQSALFIFTSLAVVCFIFPLLILPMVLVLGIMIFLDFWLNVGVRETKRLDNELKSPLIHHLQSSFAGLVIIRTFNRQEIFETRFSGHLDRHLAAEAIFRIANRWFTLRMEAVGLLTILITLLASIFTRGSISSAGVGLALANIYMVCTFVPFVMRMKSELQARFISVERILDYTQNLTPEEDLSNCDKKKPDGWPSSGEIKLDAVSFRYGASLPLVLDNIKLSINGGEKVGIVGRTGAGKSSIVGALLRLWPLEEGKITIDDLDIDDVTLETLRKNVSVIPQEPVLFHGSIRYNLDPFNEHTDDEILGAIRKAHLDNKISKDKAKLEAQVETDGDNFSVGEKQLLCLARALLRGNKILILDEATAFLDVETDHLIQETIKKEFADCTVITIAHRLRTVSNYDRIVVVEKGRIVEEDTPQMLLSNPESRFSHLMASENSYSHSE